MDTSSPWVASGLCAVSRPLLPPGSSSRPREHCPLGAGSHTGGGPAEPRSRIPGPQSSALTSGSLPCPPPFPEPCTACLHLLQDSGMSSGSRGDLVSWLLTGRLSGLSQTLVVTMNGRRDDERAAGNIPVLQTHFYCSLLYRILYFPRLA